MKGDKCAYCHYDRYGFMKPLDKRGHLLIEISPVGDRACLRLKFGTRNYGIHENIMTCYCPMCGRKLVKGTE